MLFSSRDSVPVRNYSGFEINFRMLPEVGKVFLLLYNYVIFLLINTVQNTLIEDNI